MQTVVIPMILAVLFVFYQTEARRHEGHRHGHGHGYGKHKCGAQTHAAIQPCWTGHISCPVGSPIQITGVTCKDRCTHDKPVACDAALQTTINTDCNGKTECTVKGVTGAECIDLKKVVLVNWSCNTTTTTTTTTTVKP